MFATSTSIFAQVAIAVIAAMGGGTIGVVIKARYDARQATRLTSGKVDTSEAVDLWAESSKMRQELRDEGMALRTEALALRDEVVKMRDRASQLERDAAIAKAEATIQKEIILERDRSIAERDKIIELLKDSYKGRKPIGSGET